MPAIVRITGLGGLELVFWLLALLPLALLIVLLVQLARTLAATRRLMAKQEEGAKQGEQASQAIQLVGSQLNERIEALSKALNEQLAGQARTLNEQLAAQARTQNEQLAGQSQATNERLDAQARQSAEGLSAQTEAIAAELARNREEMSREFKEVRQTMEARLAAIQKDNAAKLDQMRATVDEKLSETLQQRFAESFTLISERLESVQRGLGEMQLLAGNVTDLRNVLANVKTRGNFGEYQLKALLEDVFTPDQYEANFAPRPRSQARVEFAVRLPGSGDEPVFLPIDSKFPIEDYQRLLDAYEGGERDAILAQQRQLINTTRVFAKDIRDKYVNPPRTTDFALLFVPTESLYAELMREPGFADMLRREYRVHLTGPSTLQALIVSLRIGFSTLAIQRRTSEVEKLLGQVKVEFARFEDVLERIDKRLEQARGDISQAKRRSERISHRLRDVAELPEAEAALLLGEGGGDAAAEPEDAEVDEDA